jgi:hypothetical protein
MKSVSILLLLSIPLFSSAMVWEVGVGKLYTKPSAVSSLVNDGDTVFIQAGEYKKDVCIWRAHNLHLIGVGGKAHLNAEKTAYGGKAIWVIAGDNTYVENIEFSHCEVVDLNGAGIRLEGKHLTVRSCYFHDNQEGILAGDNPNSDVVVEYSEFGYNGAGDGYSHNIYINHVRSLLFQYNYVHHSFYGHEIKSRAYKNVIIYNRITNEDGSASYEIDLPNGGPSLVMGNIIQQSKFSDNNSIISYAREGLSNPGPHNFYFINNTVINEEDKGIALNIQTNTDTVFSANNIFAGPMSILVGIPKTYINLNNVVNSNLAQLNFVSTSNYDYQLTSQSPGIDSAYILNEDYLGYSLIPDKEYLHPMSWKNRYNDSHTDIGARELQQITGIQHIQQNALEAHYNPFSETFEFIDPLNSYSEFPLVLKIFNAEGKVMISRSIESGDQLKISEWSNGIYYFTISGRHKLLSGSFVVCD